MPISRTPRPGRYAFLMATVEPASTRSPIPAGPVLGTAITAGVILLLGALVPPGESPRGLAILRILILESWPALMWLLAALGLGMGLLRILPGWTSPANGEAPSPIRSALATTECHTLRFNIFNSANAKI